MELEEAPMTIVMGFDRHRARITTEWLDSMSGEIGRARIAPAHREGVRRFLGRLAGQELEVALEATTGWRFVVEELRRVRGCIWRGCIWLSRRRPARCAATRSGPRTTAPTRGICASC